MKQLLLSFIVLIFFSSCKDSKKPSYSKKKTTTVNNLKEHSGKKLMESNCYVCHSLTASENSRIAPPMIAVKKHYLTENTSKEEFVNSIQNWIKNPTEENTKMVGAVKRFGLMPKQAFPEETIKLISEYMFDNDIDKPDWFEDVDSKKDENEDEKKIKNFQQGNSSKELPYDERGLKYALSTKEVLGRNLIGKIQNEGTLAALKFCNIEAYPLTDSMSILHNATIKRVSDKPRNRNNLANSKENEYIAIFKEEVKANKESNPIVVESLETVKFYYPIKTNGMCLQCHGKPTSDIKEATFSEIKKLYPKDLAIGYGENQVRGIWSITFNK